MHENALIRQAQSGDAGAFEALLGMHYDTLYKFAYKWCGNRADAEDVTQQACLKLARSIDQFNFEAAFTSWLYQVVINCAKDWRKSQRRHVENSEDMEESRQIESTMPSPEALMISQQMLGLLETLAEGIKETILLVHAEGLTHGEAAKILGIKESTVSWRLHEARKTLKLLFAQEEING